MRVISSKIFSISPSYRHLFKHKGGTKMGIFDRWFGSKQKVDESSIPKIKQPQFVRKYKAKSAGGDATYETYKGTDAESAKAFLMTKRVDKPMYYIIVDTPEGSWGIDINGLYLERLLPWQTDISKAECEGYMYLMPDMYGVEMAAKGFNTNYIAMIHCGKCEHDWMDGVLYDNLTVVRCPKCKALNKVDSSNVKVALI